MRLEECAKLGECHKVRAVFDKDVKDFRYVEAMREVCANCSGVTTGQIAALEGRPGEPRLEQHIVEALYGSIAESEGDEVLSKRLRARTKFRLVNMSDDEVLAFVTAIAQHERLIESAYTAFQNVRAGHKATAGEWMKDLLLNEKFQGEESEDKES